MPKLKCLLHCKMKPTVCPALATFSILKRLEHLGIMASPAVAGKLDQRHIASCGHWQWNREVAPQKVWSSSPLSAM